jgi:hypothetical protein
MGELRKFGNEFNRTLDDCKSEIDFENLISEIAISIKLLGVFHPEIPVPVIYIKNETKISDVFWKSIDKAKNKRVVLLEQEEYNLHHGNHRLVTDACSAIYALLIKKTSPYSHALEAIKSRITKKLQMHCNILSLSMIVNVDNSLHVEKEDVGTMYSNTKINVLQGKLKHGLAKDYAVIRLSHGKLVNTDYAKKSNQAISFLGGLRHKTKLYLPEIPNFQPVERNSFINNTQLRFLLKEISNREDIWSDPNTQVLAIHKEITLSTGHECTMVSAPDSYLSNLKFTAVIR